MTENGFTIVIQRVKEARSRRIALAGADDPMALEAVARAHREELAEATLVGNPAAIRATAAGLGLDLSPFELIESADAAGTTAALVGRGSCDVLMKGSVTSKDYLKAVLNEGHGLRTGRLLSHVMVAALPAYPKLLFLTDAALNIAPTLSEKADILRNAVETARRLGVARPKVAVLAAVEQGELDLARLDNYRKLRRELQHQAARTDAGARLQEKARERQFGKMMHNFKKGHFKER